MNGGVIRMRNLVTFVLMVICFAATAQPPYQVPPERAPEAGGRSLI